MAVTNPSSTIHCLSSSPISLDLSTSQWTELPNMNPHIWSNPPSLPYHEESLDLVFTRSISLMVQSTDLPSWIRDCLRVLKPGGSLEISVLDPMPDNAGPLLQQWTTTYLIQELKDRFLATRPAMIVQIWLEDVAGFSPPVVKKMAFSAVMDDGISGADVPIDCLHGMGQESLHHDERLHQGRIDLRQLKTVLGRHFYQSLYKEVAPEANSKRPVSPGFEDSAEVRRHWWWEDPAILRECREYGTTFDMVTFTCQKKCAPP